MSSGLKLKWFLFLFTHVSLMSDELKSKDCVCVLCFYCKYTFVHTIYSKPSLESLIFMYLFLCQGTCIPWYSHPRYRTTLCDGFAFHLIWGKSSIFICHLTTYSRCPLKWPRNALEYKEFHHILVDRLSKGHFKAPKYGDFWGSWQLNA